MSDSTLTRDPDTRRSAAVRHHPRAFQELERRRRRFVVPATLFFLTWYFGFIVLAGYAPGFMGDEFLADGLTVGYVLALSQFVMTWGLAWWYLRKADREVRPSSPSRLARWHRHHAHRARGPRSNGAHLPRRGSGVRDTPGPPLRFQLERSGGLVTSTAPGGAVMSSDSL